MGALPLARSGGGVVDVLIHVADGVLLHDLDYADRIEERLLAAGLNTSRRDLTAWPTEPVRPARAHVFTGGETSVHSRAPWMRTAINTVRALVRTADQAEHRVIGICLGSQILAEALRPDSIVSSSFIEVGLVPVRCPEDESIQQIVPSFHYQAISPEIRSVPGVHVEWHNEHTPVQAFSYGERSFGCQYHPELSATDVYDLIDRHKDLILDRQGDPDAARRSIDQYAEVFSTDFFERTVVDRILM